MAVLGVLGQDHRGRNGGGTGRSVARDRVCRGGGDDRWLRILPKQVRERVERDHGSRMAMVVRKNIR